MAEIYPERPPQEFINDPLRRAELRVFEALKSLPDSYFIFYSIHWQSFQNEYGIREGEADFIIVHPNKGMIVLEVKGGGIVFNAESGRWYSQNRIGEKFEIQDPVAQGQRNHYEIKRKLETLPDWPNRKLNIWHAVCFPDTILREGQYLKADLPRYLILDGNDVKEIQPSIERLFENCFSDKMIEGIPGKDRMPLIERLLANSFLLRTPLAIELDEEDRQLIQLTEQQFMALSLLGDRKRVAIAGCAGSGKTTLAAHKAKQFAELKMSVLLLCFNIALSQDLRQKLPSSIEVYNFHELCRTAAKQAGCVPRTEKDIHDLYDNVLPEALLEASEKIGRVYDAIIVDEGQDFLENYWIALEPLLKEDGYLYVFFDDNQNLFGGLGTFSGLITEPPFRLTQNCRNTKAIHETVAKFHNNPACITCMGPDGRAPEMVYYNNPADLMKILQKQLNRLINEEKISHEDIVILTPHGEITSQLKPGTKLGLFELTNHPPRKNNHVMVTSVHKFKGLESQVVILAEVDQRTNVKRDMIMYVGCSRARTHLVILEEASPQLQNMSALNQDT